MAFDATKNFKKKSAGGRFEATSNFGVDDTVISSRVNAISRDIESLYNDYYKDYTERSKYVLGADSKYENMQAPGLKVSMQSYKDRAKKIKQSIEDNKAFMTPEGYLAALQNVNSIIDTDTTENDKTFSDYFNSVTAAGGREKYNKIVEKRAAAQRVLKKAGLNENSKYRDIEAAISDRTIDAGAAPDEMGQGRRYQGRKLTDEDKDNLSSLLKTEEKVNTLTDEEVYAKVQKNKKDAAPNSITERADALYAQLTGDTDDAKKYAWLQTYETGEAVKLDTESDTDRKEAEEIRAYLTDKYGISNTYTDAYSQIQQKIKNENRQNGTAYYYTNDKGSGSAMTWENLYYERKVGDVYDKIVSGEKRSTLRKLGLNEYSTEDEIKDAIKASEEKEITPDDMEFGKRYEYNRLRDGEKEYLLSTADGKNDEEIVYKEHFNTEAAQLYARLVQLDDWNAKTQGITNPTDKSETYDSLTNEKEKLEKQFEELTGVTFEAVRNYADLQKDKERSEKFTDAVGGVVEKVEDIPTWAKLAFETATGNPAGIVVYGGQVISEANERYDVSKDFKMAETILKGAGFMPSTEGVAAIAAIPGNFLSGFDYIGDVLGSIGRTDVTDYNNYRPVNIYDDYATLWSEGLTGEAQEILQKNLKEAGWSDSMINVATVVNSGVASGLNSIATVAGCCAMFGPAIGQVVSAVVLSGQAASQATKEAIDNGSTAGEALATGFASGVAEYLGEKISLGFFFDHIINNTLSYTGFKNIMSNLGRGLLGGVIEGSEEVFTSLMNRWADYAINADHSQLENAKQQYMRSGMSEKEAKEAAVKDWWKQTFDEFIGGMIGGLMGSGASFAANSTKAAIAGVKNVKKQTNIGKAITGTDAGKNLLEIAEKRGFDISKASEEVPEGRGVGKLVSKVRNAARNRNMGKLAQNVVEAELKAAKETAMPIVNNNESLAEMVAEIATGTADVSAISVLSANGVLTEENVGKVFEALEAVQKRTETAEVRNMINDIVETKESSEGKAYNASSIYGIKREGGKTKYILEDGTEVDSGEFGLTSKDKTLFVNAVKGMTDAEANEMISAYRKYANGTDKGVFATTWGLYRSLGETGAAKNSERVAGYKSRIYFTQDAEVNNVLVTSAIEQGVKARAQSEMKRNIKARAERVIQERGRAKGEVRGEEHLGKNKSGAKNVARTLAKLGYDVEFLSEDAKLEGERIGETLKNGAYDEKTNTIYLRADAKYNATDVRGILGHTLAHEVTHSIKTWSEADYNVLTDYIRDALGADFDALVKDKMNKLNMGYTMASDEVIADGCEMLLRDSKALEKLAMENANLFVKVVTKVREFIANLRKAQTDMYGGNEELHDASLKLREALKSLEEVQEVFDNALENSIRNMRDALAEAENAKTRENLDVLEKQAEKEGLQLSEETADEFAEKEKAAIEKALANMSVKDYNRRGWLRTLLTREDASKLNSAVAELFTNKKRKEFRLKDGSYAVEVNNKIIFVSGTFENPRYESVLVFNTDNATDMEFLKDQFFGNAATRGLSQKDIERFIKQRRGNGQVYGFYAEDYKASGRRDFGRAMLRNDAKGFGDTARLEVRDGIHTKDEGDVSLRVQGLKFSEETDSDSSAKTAAKLKKEIATLRELVKLQSKLTHGTLYTDASAKRNARELISKYNISNRATGKVAQALKNFYSFIASSENISWEDVSREAGNVVDLMLENENALPEEDAERYSEIKRKLRDTKIYFSENVVSELKSIYGKDVFTEKLFGKVGYTTRQGEGIELDVIYQELSDSYPDVFPAVGSDTQEAAEFIEVVDRITKKREAVHATDLLTKEQKAFAEADMIYDVYDSYFSASDYETVADKWSRKVELEKIKTLEAKRKTAEAKAELRQAMKDAAKEKQEALRSQKHKYQEAAQGIKDTLAQREEDRRRREIVRDIAKRIDKLDKLAKEDSKTKHIPSALRDIVKAFREQIDSRTQNYDERIAKAENAIADLEKKRGKYLDAYTEYTQLSERIKQYDKGSKDYADADARMGQLKQDFDRYNSLTEQIEKKLSSIEKYGERNVRAADYLSEMLSYYKTYDNADSTYYIDVSDIARAIEDLQHSIGERPLYMLTADQLEDVLTVTKAVQKKIADANKLFRSSRSVSDTTAKVAGEAKDARNKKVSRSDFVRGAKDRTANILFWNNLKPYELFKQSGSDTLYQLYRTLQRAEGDSGRLILKYADKYRETAQKYGIKEKMFNQKFDITFDNGKTARLTGGEILTLYLTAKRGQGRTHLLGDGFRLAGGKMRLVADGKETVYTNADMMMLTENDLTKFGKTLSDDMRSFGDEMQKYMSTVIAADGNAVSMKLYDIMLFGEDNYITLTVDNNYLRSTIDPKKNTAKLKNSKFTIKTVANATQGLSISSFVDVYQTHASDMAAYAAFTLPLEDITKVINGTSQSEDGGTRVRDVLGSKLYGEMMKFLTDVNGGIRSDGDLAYMRLFSAVKAARTGLNIAVAIQQPCAIVRAFAEINPKYFIGVKAKTMSEAQQRKSLAEMTQYASTWVVKQLGGVDINTKQSIGKTITDLGAKGNTFGHTAAKGLQEGQFWVAEKLDQVTWACIWNACRNEAIDNFKKSNADYTYKDVLKKAGDRFDEITNKTQVYDSIFARSKIMRDGKAFEKFITQFMAEPMTTLNMAYDGIRLLMNGEKGKAAGIFASLIVNGIFTAAIRSFADAFRDDDDDKNYWEKYLQALIENSIDNINPFMLLPWFKDIYSLVFNGFNVDRPDVEIIGDLMTKVKKLAKVWGDESKNAKERAEASWDALSILADMSGVAMTSLTRDFRAIYRTIATEWQSATKTTTNTAADTAWKNGLSRNLTTPRDNKGKLYYAFMHDDDTYIARTQDRLGEKDFRRRVIDGLKDNDIRIAEAAAAHIDGDYEKYDSIIRDIANDGFDKEYVVAAVVSAENKALKDSAGEDVDTVSQIDGMTATKKDIIADVEEGNYDLLEEYYRLKVDYYKEKEADDPEGKAFTSVRSLLSGHYRELYKDGDEDERERIADILSDVTVDGHKVIKKATVRKWKND